MEIKVYKDNSHMALVGNVRLSFTRPIKTIKTVKCRVCNEVGDLLFCADHISKNKTGHFDSNLASRNSSRRAFDVVEKV